MIFRVARRIALLCAAAPLLAQSTLETGNLRGRVTDAAGKPLPGAQVRARGPQGVKAGETDGQGNYTLPFLPPGAYEVTATMDGYSTQSVPGVTVGVQQVVSLPFKLAEGSETVIVKAKAAIDPVSTRATTSVNLQSAIRNFAQSTNFASAFDFAPGVNADAGVGGGNVSIGGASGLENQYLIGGINFTGSGYGSFGAYDTAHGATSSGVTSEFLENLDVHEGGFDAEYGAALGGVVSATVRRGGNDYHGSATLYWDPARLEGGRTMIARSGGFTNQTGDTESNLALSVSGPIVKDRLFYFAGYNPVWTRESYRFDVAPADLARDQITAPNANREFDRGNNRVDNYALRFTWNLNERHSLDLLALGSPQSRSGIIRNLGRRVNPRGDFGFPVAPAPGGVPDTDSVAGARGSTRVSEHAAAIKYFGSLTPSFNVEASVAFHGARVSDRPTAGSDVILYRDIRRLQIFNSQTRNLGQPGVPSPALFGPSTYAFGGIGGYQGGSNDENLTGLLKMSWNFSAWGLHELKWGAEIADMRFHENYIYSGPRPQLQLVGGDDDTVVEIRTGVSAQIRCAQVDPTGTDYYSACESLRGLRYRVDRGNFNPAPTDTRNRELNLFVQDNWQIKNFAVNLGLRYTREKVANDQSYQLKSARSGNPLKAVDNFGVLRAVGSLVDDGQPYDPVTNPYLVGPGWMKGRAHTFQAEFSPRVGLSWDPRGDGRSKLFVKYSRMFERVPNDLAVRSFGNEFGLLLANYTTPDLTTQTGAIYTTSPAPTRISPGTRLPYKDDVILGYQFEVRPGARFELRANFRKQGRVLEDTQSSPIEAIQNYYYGPNPYYTGCLNCSPSQPVLFPGYGQARFGQYVLANIGENSPTAYRDLATGLDVPITFGKPRNEYRALTLSFDREPREGERLFVHASLRWSSLTGNYEGLFRNDNGQSDPNITSLYDFPLSHLTRSQYFDGRLNTDTPLSLRLYTGWRDMLVKNLSGALTVKWQSGKLRTPLVAHPMYQNSGEIPGTNPAYYLISWYGSSYADSAVLKDYDEAHRGDLGHVESAPTLDAQLAYEWPLGKSTLRASLLINNFFNRNAVTGYDDDVETQTGIPNPFYGSPLAVHDPRRVRLGLQWSF